MKRVKKVLIVAATMILTVTAITGVAFADVNYDQWNSQAAYPKDVVNTPLFSSVKFLIDKKIMTGYPDGTFKPDGYITRAEIAVAVTKMTNRTSLVESMAKKNVYSDLQGYDWAKGHINALSDAGILKGTSNTTFSPGKNISYAELITILIRTKPAAAEYETYGKWPDNYIQYAQMYNLLGNVVVTDWYAPATRGDTAKLIYRVSPKDTTTTSAITVNLLGAY